MISASRKNDAVISVCQDNQKKIVEIQGINKAAEKLLGYSKEELLGKSLNDIVSAGIRENLESYLEFEDGGNDLASVLKKTRKFQVITKDGSLVPINLKVFYVIANNRNPRFELLMRDITFQEKLEIMKQQIQAQHPILDDQTGLTDKSSLLKYLELILNFVQKHGVDAVFALMGIDRFQSLFTHYGSDATNGIIKEIGVRFNANSRTEDSIGYLGKGVIGIMLFDCNKEHVRTVLNRIRKNISATPIVIPGHEESAITVSTGYMVLQPQQTTEAIVKQCEKTLELSASEGGNRIYEATAR